MAEVTVGDGMRAYGFMFVRAELNGTTVRALSLGSLADCFRRVLLMGFMVEVGWICVMGRLNCLG